MIVEALKFPFNEQDWPRKMLAGSLLAISSFLVLPAPLLMGYFIRVMREDSMPAFNNLIRMYIDGLKAFAIILAYILPGTLLLAVADGYLLVAAFLVFLAGWWSFESGLYHFANNGFKQAFDIQVLKTAFTFNYFIGIILSVIVPLSIFIGYTISLLLVVTIILFPAVYFYQGVLTWRIMKNAIEKN